MLVKSLRILGGAIVAVPWMLLIMLSVIPALIGKVCSGIIKGLLSISYGYKDLVVKVLG